MKRTPLRRKTPLARGTSSLKRTPMKRVGKRTLAWDSMRRKLKVAFQRAGITTCELQMDGLCWWNDGLGFAHSRKRRNIPPGSPLLAECALACNYCHDIAEKMPESEMRSLILVVISERKVPVVVKLD